MKKEKPASTTSAAAPVPADRPHTEERGELALALAGADMVMRPSYEAIQAFEAATGKGLLQLARESLTGSMTLTETALVAAECIRAWGRDTENRDAAGAGAPRIAALILDSNGGFHTCLKTVSAMLSMASTGGYTSQGEVKAGTTKTTKTTSGAPADD